MAWHRVFCKRLKRRAKIFFFYIFLFLLRVVPATKESFLSSSDAHFFPEIKYFQMSKIYKSYMDRSGRTCPITWPRKIGSDNLFFILFPRKTVPRIWPSPFWAHPPHQPHHGSPGRSGAAPISVNMDPTAPIFEYVLHLHLPRAYGPFVEANKAS